MHGNYATLLCWMMVQTQPTVPPPAMPSRSCLIVLSPGDLCLLKGGRQQSQDLLVIINTLVFTTGYQQANYYKIITRLSRPLQSRVCKTCHRRIPQTHTASEAPREYKCFCNYV